jgi:hypothetical protein
MLPPFLCLPENGIRLPVFRAEEMPHPCSGCETGGAEKPTYLYPAITSELDKKKPSCPGEKSAVKNIISLL